MQAELEGLRIEVEQAEKARKQASAELQAANDKTNELMLVINDHSKEKRQLEMEVNSANAAVEEVLRNLLRILPSRVLALTFLHNGGLILFRT